MAFEKELYMIIFELLEKTISEFLSYYNRLKPKSIDSQSVYYVESTNPT